MRRVRIVRPFVGWLVLSLLPLGAGGTASDQPKPADRSAADALIEFQKRIDAYAALHRQAEAKLPALATQTTPQAIAAHQASLAQLIRGARPAAKYGDIFFEEARHVLRRLIGAELLQPGGRDIRAEILADSPRGLRLKVGDYYPRSLPVATVPPSLLTHLPRLPEELEYRFAGHTLLLVDVHANIIVDYMPDAFR